MACNYFWPEINVLTGKPVTDTCTAAIQIYSTQFYRNSSALSEQRYWLRLMDFAWDIICSSDNIKADRNPHYMEFIQKIK